MQSITKEEIKHLAELARIAVTDTESERLAADLSVLAEWATGLEALPKEADCFEGAVALSELRADVKEESFGRAELLQAAPACDAEAFLVPRTVED